MSTTSQEVVTHCGWGVKAGPDNPLGSDVVCRGKGEWLDKLLRKPNAIRIVCGWQINLCDLLVTHKSYLIALRWCIITLLKLYDETHIMPHELRSVHVTTHLSRC